MSREVTEVLVVHYGEFLRFLERRVGRRDVAEDILQQTFAESLESLAKLRDPKAIFAWFYQALRHATVDHYRRTRRVERAEAQLARELETVETPPEAPLARPCQCATRVADRLKPEYADALRRIEVEGASVKGFAAERRLSSTNAAVRVFRAREALRRELEASCGTSAAQGCVACACDAGTDAPEGGVAPSR